MAGRDDLPIPAPAPAPEPPGFSFAASARRLDPVALKGEEALGTEPERHREAWAAYDEISEVGTLVSGSASLLSQCTLYVGFVDEQQEERRLRDEDGQVIEGFEEQFVADAEAVLARFSDAGGSQRGLLLAQAENFDVTGDSYLVGWPIGPDGAPWNEEEDRASGERWEVVSRGALGKAQGRWTIQLGGERAVKLPEAAIVYRMWRKHPRRPDDSRGWVLGALDVCRDLRVFTLAQRSAARSSIPAKILVTAQEASPKNLTPQGAPAGGQVPNPAMANTTGAVVLGSPPPPGGPAGGGPFGQAPGSAPAQPMAWAQQLERLIGDAVMEVLRDAQSGRAVIPAVLAVADKYVKSWDSIDLSRDIDTALSQLVDQARARLAQSADCPPEMLTGLGETNRWNGAQIADDEYRRYFRPKAMTIADAWTTELLWGGLRDLGYTAEQISTVRVLVDARGVVAEPDRSKLATEGLKVGALSWAAWRMACGFSELDAPTPEERAEILAALGTGQQQNGQQTGEVNRSVGSGAPAIEATASEVEPPAPAERPAPLAARPLPALGKLSTRTAASTDQGSLSPQQLAEQLVAIEATARTRLEEACEAALDGALARGGAKLKTWARSDAGLRALLEGVEGREVPGVLGPDRSRQIASSRFADDDDRREDLFAAALAALLLSYHRIADGTYEKLLRLLGVAVIEPGAAIPAGAAATIEAAEIARNIEAGEAVLRESMLRLADTKIFNPVTAPPIGELTSFRVPAPVVRRTMAATGGAQIEPGLGPLEDAAPGLAFGPTLAAYEPDREGWEWIYGDEVRARPYEPHLSINGEIFTGPNDPALDGIAPDGGQGYPGDHDGCRCDWQPVFSGGSEAG